MWNLSHMKMTTAVLPLLLLHLLLLLLSTHSGLALLCSQCTSEKSPDCESNPPPATNCTHCLHIDDESKRCMQYKQYEYCITVAEYINETQLSFIRACSPLPMSDNCSFGKEDVRTVKFCYTHCDTDGCNTATTLSGGNIWKRPIAFFYSALLLTLNIFH